jgi:hypothetical protein
MIKYDTESNWPTAPRWTYSNLGPHLWETERLHFRPYRQHGLRHWHRATRLTQRWHGLASAGARRRSEDRMPRRRQVVRQRNARHRAANVGPQTQIPDIDEVTGNLVSRFLGGDCLSTGCHLFPLDQDPPLLSPNGIKIGNR